MFACLHLQSPKIHRWPTCIIGSRDYCHAPLGVSSFLFSIQTVWEMTTMVYNIACHSCTACPPAIVLRLSIADTISSATVYSQCVKALRTRQKHGEFYCHDCGTASRPNKNRLARLILRYLAKMMFPRSYCAARPTQLLSWKYCRGTMTIIVPPSNFNDSHTYNTHPPTTTSTYTTRVKLCTGRKARTSITVPGNSIYKY